MTALLFVAGLLLLVLGAELLVRGASRIALAAGISPLVVGLTVVAFGTGAPELAVSVQSALAGQAGLAFGNVVGSNIFNVLMVLGCSAIVVPLLASRQIIRQEVPVMVGISLLLWALAFDGRLGRWEAAALVAILIAYTVFVIRQSRRNQRHKRSSRTETGRTGPARWSLQIALVAAGLALLVVGARWLVDSAVVFAASLGMSKLVVGLTVVSAGTSLPEVATSVVAALRGEREMAVGNVVGSNIFNILGVLGVSGLVSPTGLAVAPDVLGFGLLVMIGVSIACLPVFFTGRQIARWEGALFVAYYGAYTLYLILEAGHHPAFGAYRTALVGFVLPLTMLTLVVVTLRDWRRGRRG